MVIVIANDVESNPGPILDRCFHYVRNYLNNKDYKSSVLKENIDTLLALQSSDGFSIPEDFLTDDNITLWADVRDKAYKDGFDEDFCQKVFSIWKYWEDQAVRLEFPKVQFPSRSIQKRTNQEKVVDTRNLSIKLFDKQENPCGFFKYQLNQNNHFICLVENCKKGKKPMKIRESFKDHVRKDHSFQIDLQKKIGFKAEPFKCACGKTFTKKQTLNQHRQKCQELERVRAASASGSPSPGTFSNDVAQPQVQPADSLFAGNLANPPQFCSVDNGRPKAPSTSVDSTINTYPPIPETSTKFDGKLSTVNLRVLEDSHSYSLPTISIPTDHEADMSTIHPPIMDDYGRAGATSTSLPFISNNHLVHGHQTVFGATFDMVNEIDNQEEVPNISAASHIVPLTQPSLPDQELSNLFGTEKFFNN